MNELPQEQKVIFVTPFLEEIERIKDSVTTRNFYDPKDKGTKLKDLHRLLRSGKNIATTHSLFKSSNEETRRILKEHNYILILDEVMQVVEDYELTSKDLAMLLDLEYVHIDDDGYLIWDYAEYKGKFSDLKNLCDYRNIIVVDNKILMWKMPIDLFRIFDDVYILTYMFNAQMQRYYYDLHNVDYKFYTVDNNEFVLVGDKPKDYSDFKRFVKNNVRLYEGKYNDIGKGRYTLSYNWYTKAENRNKIDTLRKNIISFYRTFCKTNSKFNMWTCFKRDKPLLSGDGYARGHVPHNARATNKYSHKKSVAYVINRFSKPHFVKFFSTHGIKINQDEIALSDLIQFIWRSQIRDDKPINLYIPSERTRNMFKSWMNDEESSQVEDTNQNELQGDGE